MKLHIEHTTIFTYEEPISEAYTEMRLRPLEGAGQRCLWFRLATEPTGDVMQYTDRFGNNVHHFDTLQSHDRVLVKAASDVYMSDKFTDEQKELSPLDMFDYLAPGNYTPINDQVRSFASQNSVPNDQTATAFALMHAIFKSLQYERGATHVRTTALEALTLGRGVCQDFAHIMLSACRGVGIPARYVSGYLYSPDAGEANSSLDYSPDDGHQNNAASHAWIDAFVDGGWISLDPTHDCEQTMNYVRVGVGRDYSDVPPTRGVFKGKAKESLQVDVVVTS